MSTALPLDLIFTPENSDQLVRSPPRVQRVAKTVAQGQERGKFHLPPDGCRRPIPIQREQLSATLDKPLLSPAFRHHAKSHARS